MPFELLHSEPILKGRAFTIRRDTMKAPDGRETHFDIVEHGGSVVIIPVDNEGNCSNCPQARVMEMNHTKNAPHARYAKRRAWKPGH